MGNNPSRFGGYPDQPHSWAGGYPGPGYPGMQSGWSNTYKRQRSNSAGWYPGELGYGQPPTYPQTFPQYVPSELLHDHGSRIMNIEVL